MTEADSALEALLRFGMKPLIEQQHTGGRWLIVEVQTDAVLAKITWSTGGWTITGQGVLAKFKIKRVQGPAVIEQYIQDELRWLYQPPPSGSGAKGARGSDGPRTKDWPPIDWIARAQHQTNTQKRNPGRQ